MNWWQARTLLAWGAALVLPACAPGGPASGSADGPAKEAPPRTATSRAADTGAQTTTPECRPQAAQDALGLKGSPELAERARLAAGAASVRVIGHDDMVTKEFLASRLNLLLDEEGLVTKIYCG